MNKSNYLFTSERLGFRNWKHEDLVEFSKLNSDEEVMEHFPNTLSEKEVKELIKKLNNHFTKNGFTYYATELLATTEFIGMIGLAYQEYHTAFTPAVDIGWRLKKSAWGKGYATEGAKRCLQYAFQELGISKIISVCTIKNQKSENVMKKIGMTKVGIFNHPNLANFPAYQKHFCYEITKNNKRNFEIIEVKTEQEFDMIRTLFREYQLELGKDLSFQSFEEELQNLPKIYQEEKGALLLLKDLGDEQFVGCIGLKSLANNICEMKRLYVKPLYRNKKYGLELVHSILSIAKKLNYQEICLDTLKELKAAINLYKKLGFIETEPYYYNPYEDVVFMRKRIQ